MGIPQTSNLQCNEDKMQQWMRLSFYLAELEAENAHGFHNKTSYYVRLGSLSTKLRKRAYTRAVSTIHEGKQRSLEFISELNSTVDLVGFLISHNI